MIANRWIEILSKEIQRGNLPGEHAQRLMSPRPVNDSRFNFKSTPTTRKGGVMILFYPDDDGVSFPLTLRASYQGVHGGEVSFPGGKMDPEDTDIVATAIRETEEEIGVRIDRNAVIGTLSPLFIPASNFMVYPSVAVMEEKPQFLQDQIEVAKILPTPLERVLKNDCVKEKHMLIRNQYEIISPYYDLHDQVVWGATAMILSELIFILKAQGK
ncbi:MAG: CoA pyrophosphatase [Cyclobacteriaceae bacterium]|nr:CoA pyrophosphatase [Cyclobacteriaceae bacterium]MCH8515812.1 CoA pyrophosphatase [Cyclobacteriaceae bacterium]